MRERDVTDTQVHACLRRGTVVSQPLIDDANNWKVDVELYVAGDHLSCAVALDLRLPRVIVITAFWVL